MSMGTATSCISSDNLIRELQKQYHIVEEAIQAAPVVAPPAYSTAPSHRRELAHLQLHAANTLLIELLLLTASRSSWLPVPLENVLNASFDLANKALCRSYLPERWHKTNVARLATDYAVAIGANKYETRDRP